ncbi:phosphate ABC transporter permease PstA [Halobaculum sp. MBLA0143]|uniref:phosphate ABC transporter permease PstA n=1 Tax=Halobaculum sp. MBLA0143 TaxID=3079933 RepID=UPI0035266005
MSDPDDTRTDGGTLGVTDGEEQSALVTGDTTVYERVAASLVGLSVVTFSLGVTTLFRVTETGSTRILGLGLYQSFGLAMGVAGVGVAALGLVSRAGIADTAPDPYTGAVPMAIVSLLWLATGSVLGSAVLGLGAVGGVALGVVTAVAAFVIGLRAGEDVGSTVPVGTLVAVVGLSLLAGVIGPEWVYDPETLIAEFPSQAVVPVFAMGGGLLAAWSGAKAHAGFGTRGRQQGSFLLISMNAAAMIAVLAALIGFVAIRGFGPMMEGFTVGLSGIDWPFVTNPSQGLGIQPGVFPAIVGTVWLVVGAVSFSVPLAVGAAVFLTEYAEQGRFTQGVEVATNGLWSTPSVVYGLFGLAFLVPRFNDTRSLLVGQLVLGFMLLPLCLITSREAIKSVPDEYRDASVALGVNRWQTIRSVVLPAAMPGIITGVILGVGRIAGETAPILLVAAGATFPSSAPAVLGSFQLQASPPFVTNPALLEAGSALPYQLYAVITAGVGETQAFGWGTALVLLLVVLGFYAIGIASRVYFRRKLDRDQ